MNSDSELLGRYSEGQGEDAFAELVRRHVNLVYSAALRQVNGDAHLAQDVAQSVFTDLARKAATLSRRPALTGWLYTSTHFAALKAVRSESRRRAHEQEAQAMQELIRDAAPEPDWEHLGPVLDREMHALNEADRELLLMRYFENRRLAEIGSRLGLSEEAVRKRVGRALDKLRARLSKQGIVTTASVAGLISANAVQAAPAGLAATLAGGALAGAALTGATAVTLTKTMAMTTVQKTLMAGAFAVLAGAGLYEAQQAWRLGSRVQTLQQEQAVLTEQVERMSAENKGLSNQLAQAGGSPSVTSDRLRELLRLRGEVGVLRRQQRELEQALAVGERKGAQNAAHATTGPSEPGVRAPFQVQLVAEEPGENTEILTNNASGANDNTLQVNKTPLLDYTAIRAVNVRKNTTSGKPEIDVELSDEGRELFAAVTREHLNKRLAIVLNGQVYAAPVIRTEITGGKALITGSFTEEEAQQLAAKINEAIRYQ